MQLRVDSGQLPVGWEIKYLDKLCENLDSKRVPITKFSRKSGNIPYYGASGIVDYVDNYIFDEDLLLVSEDGANLLARSYPIAFSITGKTWVNNNAHVLRFKEKITQSFIEYYLNSISLEPYVSGMAQPKLNQKSLNSIPIPFPPLPEQRRIVAILDEAFEGIDRAIANTEKNLANSRELFESYLNAIFTQKGNGWTETKLGDVCEKVEYGSSAKSLAEGEIPVLRMGNIQKTLIF
ncbi:MAG: restriction endonuclease subunit S [Chlorogloeopsis fritschii C42_A2020_084]|uniref:restriction endonuclease subunit S n=1 Tax=Chlorogloeopsis fritschii TaxID=1124 RepID=UPI001A001FE1|nr:restriction endonuclease subunit S [Chlorogloeopsis fritschii]MBF2006341.1 restriction endonuclease subunit S [Chlorogloeopsis fritschii C42_A2020_084]